MCVLSFHFWLLICLWSSFFLKNTGIACTLATFIIFSIVFEWSMEVVGECKSSFERNKLENKQTHNNFIIIWPMRYTTILDSKCNGYGRYGAPQLISKYSTHSTIVWRYLCQLNIWYHTCIFKYMINNEQ